MPRKTKTINQNENQNGPDYTDATNEYIKDNLKNIPSEIVIKLEKGAIYPLPLSFGYNIIDVKTNRLIQSGSFPLSAIAKIKYPSQQYNGAH